MIGQRKAKYIQCNDNSYPICKLMILLVNKPLKPVHKFSCIYWHVETMPSSMSSNIFCNLPKCLINLFHCKYQQVEVKQVYGHGMAVSQFTTSAFYTLSNTTPTQEVEINFKSLIILNKQFAEHLSQAVHY